LPILLQLEKVLVLVTNWSVFQYSYINLIIRFCNSNYTYWTKCGIPLRHTKLIESRSRRRCAKQCYIQWISFFVSLQIFCTIYILFLFSNIHQLHTLWTFLAFFKPQSERKGFSGALESPDSRALFPSVILDFCTENEIGLLCYAKNQNITRGSEIVKQLN
jgi:hypothetical protein